MSRRKTPEYHTISFTAMAGGGRALGELADGKKCFAWGVLPGETARVRLTKKKASFVEAVAEEIITPSPDRIMPTEPDSYLSTSPWQIMTSDAEQHYKAQLITDAFRLHHLTLPTEPQVYTDGVSFGYRNKVEFSWFSDTDAISGADTLDLAFFRRGSKGKIVVDGTALARDEINILARAVRDLLRSKAISARQLKTLLIRSDHAGNCVWQLYTKDRLPDIISAEEAAALPAQDGEVIYSDPRSPASRITERLASFGNPVLSDTVLGVPFHYATEGFFQVNLPVYEQALRDMQQWVPANTPAVDLYSGVGSIGLTIGGSQVSLVEINEHAVREMQRNITTLGREGSATAVLAASEDALDYITSNATIIVDPPRAGLHMAVIDRLLNQHPARIIYLSCNPVTQARDIALLTAGGAYAMTHAQGYNFFPRTPHIEHLVVLDAIEP
ncbi:MAG: RsmD family RNA methyltransferase [Candidatus Saccharibacteria bacterium]|nr:RsmD family RNA methyltransferase [Candidatus Saccharibacteria bacterium]